MDGLERTVHRLTFPKRERMVSQRQIDELFGGGHSSSLAAYPLRAVFLKKERQQGDSPVQLLISVPKKRFHHAVDRNRVKRQIREGWRSHQQVLREALPSDQQLLVALVWLSDQHLLTNEVEDRVVSLIQRISEKL